MKRCPKCNFLYLDSDQICDLDQAPLVPDDTSIEAGVINESTANIENIANVARGSWMTWKPLTMVTAAGLIIGLIILFSYQRFSRGALHVGQARQDATGTSQKEPANVAVAPAPPVPSPTSASAGTTLPVEPESSPAAAVKASPLVRAGSERSSLSPRPVSTGGAAKVTRGPITIQLTDGSSLQADEVWRTKAGIWYRRQGMVTLLKPGRVKAVENR